MLKIALPTAWFPPNAISQAESAYLERQPKSRAGWRILLRLSQWVMLTISLILFGGEFAGALLQRDAAPIGERLGVLTGVFIAYTVVRHFVLMLQTLSLSANSIAREKQSANWDILLLTGIDARRIIYGKWLAVVQRQLPAYIMLGLLRAGAVVYFSAFTSRSFYQLIYSPNYSNILIPISPLPLQILLAGAVIFLLTLLNLPFTAACGVAASAEARSSVMALVRALILRPITLMSVVLVSSFVNALAYAIFGFNLPSVFSRIIIYGFGAMADNGVTLATPLASYQFSIMEANGRMSHYGYTAADYGWAVGIEALLAGALYLLLTIFILRGAQAGIMRLGVLPPLRKPKS